MTDEFSRYRGARSINEKENAFKEIRKGLSKGNYVSYHGFLTSLNNRILRPGSSVDSDEFLMGLYSKWLREEQRLGIEIDARLIAFSEVFESGTTLIILLRAWALTPLIMTSKHGGLM